MKIITFYNVLSYCLLMFLLYNVFAFSKSSGVSIPKLSIFVHAILILYPFQSIDFCSSDSASSSDDCGKLVILFKISFL